MSCGQSTSAACTSAQLFDNESLDSTNIKPINNDKAICEELLMNENLPKPQPIRKNLIEVIISLKKKCIKIYF